MKQIIQSVFGSTLLSLLDGFYRYNQVLVVKEDRLKMTFQTKWGTYAYDEIIFELINARETFQWVIEIAFKCLINKSMVIYLGDINVYSKK